MTIVGITEELAKLYRSPIRATRRGPLFNAFPYSTKISPDAIALFVATHTNPGGLVFDGFAGSGTTGLAVLLCADPPDSLRDAAKRLCLPARWGPRRAILYEIGTLGAFIARVLCAPPDPEEFRSVAQELLERMEEQLSWLYEAPDPLRKAGTIRYIIWSDLLECPRCRERSTMWDACVTRKPAKIAKVFHCPFCRHEAALQTIKHITETVDDDFVGEPRIVRSRKPVWVYGSTGGKHWSRQPDSTDFDLLNCIDSEPIPDCVPKIEIPWGDLYRAGYHAGITHAHHGS